MNAAKMDSTNAESDVAGRRVSDGFGPGGRTLKLDRRVSDRDRRVNTTQNYQGPARRITIDRRTTKEERRDGS